MSGTNTSAKTSEVEMEVLCKLIAGMSRAELLELHKRINDPDQFAQHMSDGLGKAVSLASESAQFKGAFDPLVAEAVMDTAKRRPGELGDAIGPALGPAFRSMIALSMAEFNERLETVVQQSFTVQGLKWRMEAKRTGAPLADIVMRDTLQYRVEHAMLIHRDSGTLLNHAVQADYDGKDPAVLASMVSAVSQFVADAFGGDGLQGTDRQFSIDDLSVNVDAVGDLALACVIRGTPTATLRQQLRKNLEQIALQFGQSASQFTGDLEPFTSSTLLLEDCLVQQAKALSGEPDSTADSASESESKKKRGGFPWQPALIVGLSALLALGTWWLLDSRAERKQWDQFVNEVSQLPGVVITEADPDFENGSYRGKIKGLVDPLAQQPQSLSTDAQFSKIQWELAPYWSLDKSITLKRIAVQLRPPAGVTIDLKNDTLFVAGVAPDAWAKAVQTRSLPGVAYIDTSGLRAN